ncbi:MAG: DUF3592 domain-containing protein [Acidobacteriota bacterium]
MNPSGPPTPVHPSAFVLITVPFLLIALIPLAWGARAQWARGELARHGEVVPGRVTELRFVASNPSAVQQSSRGGLARGESPVVAFTTRAGEDRVVVGSVNRRPAPWVVGGAVEVVYDPADSNHADLRTEVAGWSFWFGIWCAVAALPAAIACLPIALWLRQRRARGTATGQAGLP